MARVERVRSTQNRVFHRLIGVLIGLIGFALVGWLVRTRKAPRRARVYPAAHTLIQEPQLLAQVRQNSPHEYLLSWVLSADTVIVYGSPHAQNILEDEPLAVTSDAQSVLVRVPHAHPRYYFRLHFIGGEQHNQRLTLATRELTLSGAVNFRDIGGYPTATGQQVRWGQVYRAGTLAKLTDADHEILQGLGVRLSCDLRTLEEIEESPDRLPPSITHVPLPVNTQEPLRRQIQNVLRHHDALEAVMLDAYTRLMIDRNAQVFAALFERLADPAQLPLVIHCTAGKDRTGIATALLLVWLGVPEPLILADYSLSNYHFSTFEAIGAKAIQPFKRLGLKVEVLHPLFTANPQLMAQTLAYVREQYGSVEGYLVTRAGLSAQTLAAVRQNLLE